MCHDALRGHLHKGNKINEKSHSGEWPIVEVSIFSWVGLLPGINIIIAVLIHI